MGKRFTLLDPPYFDALVCVGEALEEAHIPFVLVGGGAAQAWVASLRTQRGARRLSEDPTLGTALRKTRDVDFGTRTDVVTMTAVLNRLAATHGPGAHVLGPRALRLGAVSVSLTLGPEDLAGMSEHYAEFLDSGVAVPLRRGSTLHEIRTIGLPQLLMTKLTRRGDKAKDLLDVAALLAAAYEADLSVDFETVRRLVGADSGALNLLDDLVQEVVGPDGGRAR